MQEEDGGGSTTIATAAVDPPSDGSGTPTSQLADDQPPGSRQIPIDQAHDLISPVLRRDGSTRDAPSTATPMVKPGIPPSASRRLSSSTRGPPPLLSLPNLARSARRSTRCPASPRAHLVPRDLDKAHPPAEDPSSPKVSCFGRVHSNKKKPPEKPPFCHRCSLCLFSWCLCSCARRRKGAIECVDEEEGVEGRNCVGPEPGSVGVDVVMVVQPPVLAGMKRFASGRRSAAWADEAVERSRPSDGFAGMSRGQQLDDVDRASGGKATSAHADHDPPR